VLGSKPLLKEEDLIAARELRRARADERQANWEAQKTAAEEALERRSQRRAGSVFEQVAAAMKRLDGMPAGSVLSIYEAANSLERDIFFLAEEAGKNRREVLRMWTQPRRATREQYEVERSALDQTSAEVLQDPPEVMEDAVPKPKSRGAAKKA